MSGDLDLEDATSEPASENEFEEIGTGKEEASDDMMAERKPLPLDENEAAVAAAAAAAKAKADAKDPLRPRRKKARRACFACQRAHLTCGMVLSFFIFFFALYIFSCNLFPLLPYTYVCCRDRERAEICSRHVIFFNYFFSMNKPSSK